MSGTPVYGIWQERRTVDEFGKAEVFQGWAYDASGWSLTFDTLAEAQQTAGVWNARRDGWRYSGRQRS